MHISELLRRYSTSSLHDLLQPQDRAASGKDGIMDRESRHVLVIDCITGLSRRPRCSSSAPSSPRSSPDGWRRYSHDSDADAAAAFVDSPSSPTLRRDGFYAHNWPVVTSVGGGIGSSTSSAVSAAAPGTASLGNGNRAAEAQDKMLLESRRRRFGSDIEMLVRALCAEKGWNAIVSRRRRGCLGCAVREAGALGWNVVLRLR